MGNNHVLCPGKNPEEIEQQVRNEQIEAELKASKRRYASQVKLLLLGTGDSGKSTIAKQMKIIHLAGFDEDERRKYRHIIHLNVINYMKSLLGQIEERQLKLHEENEPHAELIRKLEGMDREVYTPELAEIISILWRDEATQEALTKTATFYLGDSAVYFLNKAKVFADPNYLPNEQDILRVRVKTTGITEVEFTLVDTAIKMVDVGGQRTERKKWIHCFEDVTAIIYVVAMSEYDLVLEEAANVNRMQESLKQFRDIANNVWFQKTPIILFLNKMDLFQQKVSKVDLVVSFPDYTGGCNLENAKKFIQQKFQGVVVRTDASHKIYPHFTTATDTENIRSIFNDIRHILLEEMISITGI